MAESSQLTSHKKQIYQDVSSDMPLTSSVIVIVIVLVIEYCTQ